MRITEKTIEKNTVTFDALHPGDVFSYQSDFWLKVEKSSISQSNAILLSSFLPCIFNKELVQKMDSELIIS